MDSYLPGSSSGVIFNSETPLLVSQQSLLNGNASYFESSFDLDFIDSGYASDYNNSLFDLGGFMDNNAFASNFEKSSLNHDFIDSRYPFEYENSPFDLVGLENHAYASNFENNSLNIDFVKNYGSQGIRSSNDHDPTDTVLKIINKALLEDNPEEISSVLYDPLTLQAAEKPFYDAIGKKYPSSPIQHQLYVDKNAEESSGSTSAKDTPGDFKNEDLVGRSHPSNAAVQLSVTSSKGSANSMNNSSKDRNGQIDSFQTANLISSMFSDSDSILQFKKGMEEAMKFLPTNNLLITYSYKYALPPKLAGADFDQSVKDHLPVSSRGRKPLYCQNGLLEEPRSRKQPAVYEREVDLSELFDQVLLYDVNVGSTSSRDHVRPDGIDQTPQQNGFQHVSSRRTTWSKKKGTKDDKVDMRTLLTSCARAIASSDRTTAYEILEQIKKHAFPTGDGSQRVAHAFVKGIEARLTGNGKEIYGASASKKLSTLEKLKVSEVQYSACPYRKLSLFFSNEMIMRVAENASTLHIVDFGISYGFQWPNLIQLLSTRQGGPPKLRITGIELPQAGFRPTSLVEESGQRLAKYCERFKVPFEYQVIVTKAWEKISVEELNLARNEVLAVSCMFRFRYLLDDTLEEDSPRDCVLKLIKKMKPDIFVHSIRNGALHVPLFADRFREAFFYYSALYDATDASMSRADPVRLYFEEEVYGRELVNIISCEGEERVERPQTYKSWHSRHLRAGLKPLPLNTETVEKLKAKTALDYHKDYEFHEDGNWVLQGWKGRILYGTSCWLV